MMRNGNDLLRGQFVRLAAQDAEEAGDCYARWARDEAFSRMLESDPLVLLSTKAHRAKAARDWPEDDPANIMFVVRTLEDDQLIGFANLDFIQWSHGDTYMGIGIGEREFRGKGYGRDALNILLRYAFMELNLRRVTLTVFEYNEQAIRMYQQAGFRLEGRHRQVLHREGRRWDMLEMGILREEWMENYGYNFSDR